MTGPTPPPLPADLEALLRHMHLPYMRRAGPEVLATARAQRWDPAEVLKVLLGEEVAGRERSALATRRALAAFPTGKTFALSTINRVMSTEQWTRDQVWDAVRDGTYVAYRHRAGQHWE